MRLYYLDEASVSINVIISRYLLTPSFQRGMFNVIARTDLRIASSLEESDDSGATILSILLNMDDCNRVTRETILQDFRNLFSNSRSGRLDHFSVLEVEVILFLMHYVFRHAAPKLVWEYHDNGNNDESFLNTKSMSLI
jgi:hypothetical protein